MEILLAIAISALIYAAIGWFVASFIMHLRFGFIAYVVFGFLGAVLESVIVHFIPILGFFVWSWITGLACTASVIVLVEKLTTRKR